MQDSSVEESTKQVANNATSKMLEKASDNAFQAYTIRNLDNKLSTTTAIQTGQCEGGAYRQ